MPAYLRLRATFCRYARAGTIANLIDQILTSKQITQRNNSARSPPVKPPSQTIGFPSVDSNDMAGSRTMSSKLERRSSLLLGSPQHNGRPFGNC